MSQTHEPLELDAAFDSPFEAHELARRLTARGVTCYLSNQTVFAGLSASGRNETTFYVRALCPIALMQEAIAEAAL